MGWGLNRLTIIGNLGREPEMRYTPNGKPVTSFSVVVSRMWTGADGERHDEHEWFNVVAWGKLAEICKSHLKKDQQVYIEGPIRTRGWEDEEGKRHFRTEVVADKMIVLGDRRGAAELPPEDEGDDTYAF
ncbi:MAG: single-stranded DNA-binding protein [Aggregatilineales bacterium]